MNTAVDAMRVRPAGRGAVTWYAYLLLGYFSYILSMQGNILPFLRDELDLSYRAVSLHTSAIAAGMMIVGLFGVTAIRGLGRRRILVVATLGSAAAAVLLTLAPAAAFSIGACLLFGLLGGFIPAVVPALLSDVQGPRRDIAFAEANAVAVLFSTTAPLITGLAIWLALGWRMAVFAAVASGLVVVVAFHRARVPESAAAPEAAARPLPPAFWFYWTLLGLGVAVEFSAILWAPAYLERVVGLSAAAASLGATAFFAGMLVGRAGGAALLRFLPIRPLFLAAAATVLVGFLGYRWGGDPAVVIAGLFVVGLGTALLYPLALSFSIAAAGPAAERGSSRVMVATGLAIMLAPPFLGVIADAAGLADALLMIPVFMCAGLAAFALGEVARRRASP
jgi:predicted MFS family arabinose efflux permease